METTAFFFLSTAQGTAGTDSREAFRRRTGFNYAVPLLAKSTCDSDRHLLLLAAIFASVAASATDGGAVFLALCWQDSTRTDEAPRRPPTL